MALKSRSLQNKPSLMLESEVFDKYYNLALRFLSFRPRSEKEVLNYLRQKNKKTKGKLSEKTIAQIMARLTELNFIPQFGSIFEKLKP